MIGQQYIRGSDPILEKLTRLAVYGPLQFISQELHWAIIVFRIAEDSKTKLRIRKYVVMQVQNKLLNVSTGTQRDGPCVHIYFRWANLAEEEIQTVSCNGLDLAAGFQDIFWVSPKMPRS
jgi:hypothetical protein